jgi:ATP-dependent RNA helicase DeaD
MSDDTPTPSFQALNLAAPIMKAITDIGYETPSPIQAESIPYLLAGHDLLGQAQTGTGKTAAFALPLLSTLDLKQKTPQLLVLAPTRELAIQVAEAFQTYARFLKGFHVLPIYGGQDYAVQLRQLKRGVHVVVGTPGRVMDHMRRGTLVLNELKAIVLDEADEMLRMGFIDDVEWILEQTPEQRQTALFSATMPTEIHRVAQRYLKQPKEIKIAAKTTTATTIRQRYWQVSGIHKLDALTRVLESEPFDAMIIFVRTKTATLELAEKLTARGHAAAALNGDMAQNQREKTVERLKRNNLDIVIATDVAARGLDVPRISHVLNYDIPYDTEAYVHRIGRTGRAGNKGEAILFVAPRERRLLRSIEKATRQQIDHMKMPTVADINEQRVARFKAKITEILDNTNIDFFQKIISDYQQDNEVDPARLSAALAYMAQGEQPLLLKENKESKEKKDKKLKRDTPPLSAHEKHRSTDSRKGKKSTDSTRRRKALEEVSVKANALSEFPDVEMERFLVDVGRTHGAKPGNIVGAVANEADIESRYIGHIEILEDVSVVDLPEGMPKDVMKTLKKARVCGRPLNLVRLTDCNASSSHVDQQGKPKKAPSKNPLGPRKKRTFRKKG